MQPNNRLRATIGLLGSLLTASVFGCAPAIPIHSGQFLNNKQISNIQPGKSTKADILSSLGAPLAIAAKDEILTIQAPTILPERLTPIIKGKYYNIASDTFFELFSGNHSLMGHHRIYYYYSAWSKKYAWFLLLVLYEVGRTDIDELWVLINEKTEVVEDYFFKAAS